MKSNRNKYNRMPVDAAIVYPTYDDLQNENKNHKTFIRNIIASTFLALKVLSLIIFLISIIIIENSKKPFSSLFKKDKMKEYVVVYMSLVLTFLFFIAIK